MPIQGLFINLKNNVWEVRLGQYLLSTKDTQMLAIAFAEAVARDAAARGVQTKLFVGDEHGEYREILVSEGGGG
jgi:hypothetical protein